MRPRTSPRGHAVRRADSEGVHGPRRTLEIQVNRVRYRPVTPAPRPAPASTLRKMSTIDRYTSNIKASLPIKKTDWDAPEGGVGLLFLVGLPTLLFALLSPGFLVTLPPARCPEGCTGGPGDVYKLWHSYRTSILAVLVHTLVFALILSVLFFGALNKQGVVCMKAVSQG